MRIDDAAATWDASHHQNDYLITFLEGSPYTYTFMYGTGGGSKMDLWSHTEWTNSTERDAPVRLLDLSKILELQGMPTNFAHQEVRAPVFSSTCLKAAAISWATDDKETTHEWHTNTYQEIGRRPHPGLKLWKETCDWSVPNLVRKCTLQAQNTQKPFLRIQGM